jgi:CheY-like chemotaxis protein
MLSLPYTPSTFEVQETPTENRLRAATPAHPTPLVLVVEDDEDTRFVYEETLAQLGYRTAGDRDGLRGVEAAIRLRPDAILMDVAVRGLDGIEATRRIKADPRTHACQVILVSARGMAMFDEARDAGSDAFFCKPFNPLALGQVLRAISMSAEPSKNEVQASVVKWCNCGRQFSRSEWRVLPLRGRTYLPQRGAVLEQRDCACGSSLAAELDNA